MHDFLMIQLNSQTTKIVENTGVKQMEIENLMGDKVESTIGANFH